MSASGENFPVPVLNPQTWIDLLTAHTAKRDMFSAKTLMTILDGIEHLALVRLEPTCLFVVSSFNVALFERLFNSFSNPGLIKAVGSVYLNEFRMPSIALKHFELARQLAPNDRELDQLEQSATLALAKLATDQPAHSALDEGVREKPAVDKIILKTTRLHRVETRELLKDNKSEMERKQEDRRKTGTIPVPEAAQDFTRIFDQIQISIEQTQFADAFAYLSEANRAGAPREELQALYGQLGLAAFDHNRLADALASYLKMRDMGPESLEGWFNCGLVYQKMGMVDEALDCYEQASRIDPANASTWCNLSSIWFEQGEYAEAERAALKALELRPDYARALDNLGASLSAMERFPEAAEACQRAIRLQPNLHSAWFKLGVIKFQQENYVAAIEAFNLTGDNADFFPYVLYYLSMIDARRGRMDEAMQKLTQARAADPVNELEPLALKELGAICTKLGRHATAADFYTQITDLRPDDVGAWLAKGTSHHRVNQYEDARDAYQRVTEIEPQNPIPWHNLGLLAADQNHAEESRDCFLREVELAPDDAKAWYDLAVSWQTLGNADEGARAYEHAEKLVQKNSKHTSDLSAAMSIVRRLNLGDRVLKTG